MEVLAQSYWFALIEDPTENQEPVTGEDGDTLPNGSGTVDPVVDPDFVEVSNMISEDSEKKEEEKKEEKEEILLKEEKESSSNDTRSVESSEIVPYLENISIQLGVIDIVIVLCLLLYIFKQFIRVPR